ncbi:hypothetical protein ACJX0J_020742, partial [Zea mays]
MHYIMLAGTTVLDDYMYYIQQWNTDFFNLIVASYQLNWFISVSIALFLNETKVKIENHIDQFCLNQL